jgi:hypothetical protein
MRVCPTIRKRTSFYSDASIFQMTSCETKRATCQAGPEEAAPHPAHGTTDGWVTEHTMVFPRRSTIYETPWAICGSRCTRCDNSPSHTVGHGHKGAEIDGTCRSHDRTNHVLLGDMDETVPGGHDDAMRVCMIRLCTERNVTVLSGQSSQHEADR